MQQAMEMQSLAIRASPLRLQEVNYIICCPAALRESWWLPRSHAASIASSWQAALYQPGMLASVGRTLDQLMDELNIKISPCLPRFMQPLSQRPVNDSPRLGLMRMDLELENFLPGQSPLVRRWLDHKHQTASPPLEVSAQRGLCLLPASIMPDACLSVHSQDNEAALQVSVHSLVTWPDCAGSGMLVGQICRISC